MKCSITITLLLLPTTLHAQDKNVPEKSNYLIFPVTTELQRRGSIAPESHWVVVNGSAAVRQDKTIDPRAIDLNGLQSQLKALRIPGDAKQKIAITILYHGRHPTEEGRILLYWAAKGLAADARIPEVNVVSATNAEDVWAKALRAVKEWDKPAEEHGVGEKLVRVYPIRTALSKLNFDGADYFVEILTPLTKNSKAQFSQDEEAEIKTAIAKLKLPNATHMVVGVKAEFGTPPEVYKQRYEAAGEMVKRLGLKTFSLRTEH